MSALPTPRYAIGDTFYVSRWETRQEAITCPDCLGTQRWAAATPAGETLSVSCARCNPYGHTETAPLKRNVCRGYVEAVTVTGVIIDTTATAGGWQKSPVSYAAGCSRYDESRTFDTSEAAQADADEHAAEEQAKLDARSEQQNAIRQSGLTVTLAVKQALWNSHYHAWAELRRVREAVAEWVDGDKDHCGCHDEWPELSSEAEDKLREIVEPVAWLERRNPLNRLVPLLQSIVSRTGPTEDEMAELAQLVGELAPDCRAEVQP